MSVFRFCMLAIMLLVVTLMPMSVASQGGLTLKIQADNPGSNYAIGESFTIETRVENVTDFNAWELDLDVMGVTHTSYADDSWFTDSGQSVWNLGPVLDEEAGFFEFQRGRAGYGGDGPSGSGLLGTFSVTATENVTDSTMAVIVEKSILAEGGRNQNHVISIPGYTISRFKDVPFTNAYYAGVEAYYDLGYIEACSGYDFCPDYPINHLTAAIWSIKTIEGNIPQPACSGNDMADVTTADWWCGWAEYADSDVDIIEAENKGDEGESPPCIEGQDLGGDECWYANSPVLNSEVARILWRAGHHMGKWDKNDGDNDCEDFFTDSGIQNDRYCSEIGRLADVYWSLSKPATVAVMPGCPAGQFCPNDMITRGELVDLLSDLLAWSE